jgi:hypothetical protein
MPDTPLLSREHLIDWLAGRLYLSGVTSSKRGAQGIAVEVIDQLIRAGYINLDK